MAEIRLQDFTEHVLLLNVGLGILCFSYRISICKDVKNYRLAYHGFFKTSFGIVKTK